MSNVGSRKGHRFALRSVLTFPWALTLIGCVSLHAPLLKDAAYPADWPDLAGAGEECQALDGTYANAGVLALAAAKPQAVFLTQLLALSANAGEISLSVKTQRLDQRGDAFSTLVVALDGDRREPRELTHCFCVRQTLACTQLDEKYWSIPNFGLGGSQSNVYLSSSTDGSLIVKLQHYHADVVLGLPLYRGTDTWARFSAVRR